MLAILQDAYKKLHQFGGKPPTKLFVEDTFARDSTYQGIAAYHSNSNSDVPFKKSQKHSLTAEEKAFNRQLATTNCNHRKELKYEKFIQKPPLTETQSLLNNTQKRKKTSRDTPKQSNALAFAFLQAWVSALC